MKRPHRPARLPREGHEARRQARRDARTLADAYSLSDAARRVVEEGLVNGEIPSTPKAVVNELVAADLMALMESPTQLELWCTTGPLPALLHGRFLAFSGDRLRELARTARAGSGVSNGE